MHQAHKICPPKNIVQKYANIEQPTTIGTTILHVACKVGDTEVIIIGCKENGQPLEYGTAWNAKKPSGDTL